MLFGRLVDWTDNLAVNVQLAVGIVWPNTYNQHCQKQSLDRIHD